MRKELDPRQYSSPEEIIASKEKKIKELKDIILTLQNIIEDLQTEVDIMKERQEGHNTVRAMGVIMDVDVQNYIEDQIDALYDIDPEDEDQSDAPMEYDSDFDLLKDDFDDAEF